MSDYVVTLPKNPVITFGKSSILSLAAENSYAYPILRQTTSYRTGDEGWQLANVWNAVYGQNTEDRRGIIGLLNFYTLESNNEFGNTKRFTTADGSEIENPLGSEGNEFYDNYSGLRWKRQDTASGNRTWNQAIDEARAYDDGTWYLPPDVVLFDLLDTAWLGSSSYNSFMSKNIQWSSTTNKDGTTFANYVQMATSGKRVLRSSKAGSFSVNGWVYKLI